VDAVFRSRSDAPQLTVDVAKAAVFTLIALAVGKTRFRSRPLGQPLGRGTGRMERLRQARNRDPASQQSAVGAYAKVRIELPGGQVVKAATGDRALRVETEIGHAVWCGWSLKDQCIIQE